MGMPILRNQGFDLGRIDRAPGQNRWEPRQVFEDVRTENSQLQLGCEPCQVFRLWPHGPGAKKRERSPPHYELGKRMDRLYSTCASPVVPHLSTRHAHGCLASEIGRDPAFPTRYDRTEDSSRVSSPDRFAVATRPRSSEIGHSI